MYDDHYGLSGRPFQLTPDPRFWFDTATHRKAMAYLGYGLNQGEGFIVITGDVGAGKTTLVGHLMATIDRDRLHAIRIVSTQIEADDLLRMVGNGLDLPTDGMTKAQLLTAIERALHATARSGRRTLLIVDEAQALPVSALEELRMLSNFQAGGQALLQIFLLGQPEFRDRLHGSDRLEQLRQRVIATHHLDPMEREEVAPYMKHRLGVVGWTGRPQFTEDAFAALYDGSHGVPRRLNQLAGRVLLSGAIEQIDTIDAAVVHAVLADIANDVPERSEPLPIVKPSEPTAAPRPIRNAVIEEGGPDSALLARVASRESRAEEPVAPDRSLEQAIAAIESRLETVSAGVGLDRGLLARLTSLEARVDTVPKLDPPLAERLASVEGRTDQIMDTLSDADRAVRDDLAAIDSATRDRIAALENRLDEIDVGARAPDAALGALEAKIEALAARTPQGDPAVADHLESLEAALEHLAARPTDPALLARLDALEARIESASNTSGDPADHARLAALEARIEEQDAALRRVLTLLVAWIEGDGSHDAAPLRRDWR